MEGPRTSALDRPIEQPALEVSALDRVGVSLLANRLLPTSAAIAVARGWALGRWHTSVSARLEALRWASTFLDEDPTTPALRRLARHAHVERAARTALALRPWKVRGARVQGLGHLVSATGNGRGAILMFAHLNVRTVLLALAGNGLKYHLLRGPVKSVRTFDKLVKWKQIEWLAEAGVKFVHPGGAYGILRAELEREGICAIAFDMMGARETLFIGRQVRMASGIASLSREAGVPVIPVLPGRGYPAEIVRLRPPVEPGNFATVDELQACLADIVSEAIAEHPELTYPPVAAVRNALSRTPYARSLEKRLAHEKRRRARAEDRATAAQIEGEIAVARVRAIEASAWWRLGKALSSGNPRERRQPRSKI